MNVVICKALRVARLLVVDGYGRQFKLSVRITVLCPTPMVTLMLPFLFEVIYCRCLAVIVRVFVQLLAYLTFIFLVFVVLDLVVFVVLYRVFV